MRESHFDIADVEKLLAIYVVFLIAIECPMSDHHTMGLGLPSDLRSRGALVLERAASQHSRKKKKSISSICAQREKRVAPVRVGCASCGTVEDEHEDA